jgi:hypothetical protein
VSEAQLKNQAALQTLGLAPELINRLAGIGIGIYSDRSSNTASGRLIAEALAELLGRFWPKLHATGPLAEDFVTVASEAAHSAALESDIRSDWAPPYQFVISIGCAAPRECGPVRRIGADGWTLSIGLNAVVTENPNPIGPAGAAALIAADALKATFATELGERSQRLPEEFQWSMFDYQSSDSNPDPRPLEIGDAAIFGTGAVTHGLAWLMGRWPAAITGNLDLCDKDKYGRSNAQRYVGMRSGFLHQPKVERLRDLLGRRDGLLITPHETDMNAYFDAVRPNCALSLAIAGVDSHEHRRQLAMKLPRRIVNMWTDAERLGASRYGFQGGWACLYCAYPRDESGAPDEVAQIQTETNLAPARIRSLLNSSDPLSGPDAAVIAVHLGVDASQYLGQQLRSVRAQLCAIGRIQIQPNAEPIDVPFAFGSFLAGLGGFIELIKEGFGDDSRRRWQFNSLRVPVADNYWPMTPTPGCYLCGDVLTQSLVKKKYH